MQKLTRIPEAWFSIIIVRRVHRIMKWRVQFKIFRGAQKSREVNTMVRLGRLQCQSKDYARVRRVKCQSEESAMPVRRGHRQSYRVGRVNGRLRKVQR